MGPPRHLFELLLVVQCCNVICRQPLNSVLNVKVLVKLEKALVGAISVIVKTDGSFAALVKTHLCWMYHDLFPGCTPAVTVTTVTSDTSDSAVSCLHHRHRSPSYQIINVTQTNKSIYLKDFH